LREFPREKQIPGQYSCLQGNFEKEKKREEMKFQMEME
jgi:hypothetical protein